jgi:hypothetical protein
MLVRIRLNYLTFPWQWQASSGNRFYFENMPSLLDSPGEFYFNASTRELHWIAPGCLDPNYATIVYPNVVEVVTFNGGLSPGGKAIRGISFVNMTIAHAAVDLSSCYAGSCSDQSASFLGTAAVHITGAQNISFIGVSVAHVGGYGIWFDEGTFNSTVSKCNIFDLGNF